MKPILKFFVSMGMFLAELVGLDLALGMITETSVCIYHLLHVDAPKMFSSSSSIHQYGVCCTIWEKNILQQLDLRYQKKLWPCFRFFNYQISLCS